MAIAERMIKIASRVWRADRQGHVVIRAGVHTGPLTAGVVGQLKNVMTLVGRAVRSDRLAEVAAQRRLQKRAF